MSAPPLVFVDTNVFVYLRDSRDPAKQQAAAEWTTYLWESRTGRVSAQVLHEYYATVTAKLDPGMEAEDAREDVRALRAWNPIEPTENLLELAWETQDRWGFSFWDSLIVAAARSEACDMLLTEDLSHGQDLGGLRVVNPFKQAPPDITPELRA